MQFRFYIVPSRVVADYVQAQHAMWLDEKETHKDSSLRVFQIGENSEKYQIPTPTVEEWEENWDFKDGWG
ncbi:MAG TPA: hypothetical protein VH681_13990 [Nitrospiraceae bacterium]|jgi:hypothetical protein